MLGIVSWSQGPILKREWTLRGPDDHLLEGSHKAPPLRHQWLVREEGYQPSTSLMNQGPSIANDDRSVLA